MSIETYLASGEIFEEYDNNLMLQDAVERNIITIGEAMNALLKIDENIPVSNSRRIVDARNKLTHGYDEIENTIIWAIIINYLPVLKSEVAGLLEDNT